MMQVSGDITHGTNSDCGELHSGQDQRELKFQPLEFPVAVVTLSTCVFVCVCETCLNKLSQLLNIF